MIWWWWWRCCCCCCCSEELNAVTFRQYSRTVPNAGDIPPRLSGLSRLRVLNLRRNMFAGKRMICIIPGTNKCKWQMISRDSSMR